MADLTKLILPVKNTATGDITNEEFDLPGSGGSEYFLEQTVTLSTSIDTVVTFNDSKITASGIIDVYTTISNLGYTGMSISAGTCSITYPKQSTASTIGIRIYIR